MLAKDIAKGRPLHHSLTAERSISLLVQGIEVEQRKSRPLISAAQQHGMLGADVHSRTPHPGRRSVRAGARRRSIRAVQRRRPVRRRVGQQTVRRFGVKQQCGPTRTAWPGPDDTRARSSRSRGRRVADAASRSRQHVSARVCRNQYGLSAATLRLTQHFRRWRALSSPGAAVRAYPYPRHIPGRRQSACALAVLHDRSDPEHV